MRKVVIAALLVVVSSVAHAQTTAVGTGVGISGSQSQAGAISGSQLIISNPASTNSTNSTVNRQSGTTRVIAAPSVFAPGLAAAGIETCLGSVSGGVAFPGGGFSVGSTVPDSGCAARLDARTLWAFGLKAEAISRLCLQPEMRQALGGRCPQAAPANVQTASVTTSPSNDGGVWLIEGKTGKERYCLRYDEAARRCRQWQ